METDHTHGFEANEAKPELESAIASEGRLKGDMLIAARLLTIMIDVDTTHERRKGQLQLIARFLENSASLFDTEDIPF